MFIVIVNSKLMWLIIIIIIILFIPQVVKISGVKNYKTKTRNYYYYYYYLLHHKAAHREYNTKQQNAKTLKQYEAKKHKRVSAATPTRWNSLPLSVRSSN